MMTENEIKGLLSSVKRQEEATKKTLEWCGRLREPSDVVAYYCKVLHEVRIKKHLLEGILGL